MAVGDVSIGISSANTVLTVQPSGTNVLEVNCVFSATSKMYSLTDGANVTQQGYGVQSGNSFYINNTIYLNIAAQGAGDYSGYSAIQIK